MTKKKISLYLDTSVISALLDQRNPEIGFARLLE
jgi:hypothetical protein